MKTCDMALRLKAHTADAAMLFLNVRKRKERENRGWRERTRDKEREVLEEKKRNLKRTPSHNKKTL